MTELQWLIKMLTQHKLSTSLKDLFIERIGEVEAALSNTPKNSVTGRLSLENGGWNPPGRPIQAPSMQRIMDEVETPALPPRVIVPQEVVISKGNGTSTRGPRKF